MAEHADAVGLVASELSGLDLGPGYRITLGYPPDGALRGGPS